MLRALGYPKDTLVANLYEILPTRQILFDDENIKNILGNFNLTNVIYKSDYKKYASTPSAKCIDFDCIKHPELLKTVESPIEAKLIKYALFKLLKF